MLTGPQNAKYFYVFGRARKANPGLSRLALHEELGLPESHTHFTGQDLDRWIDRCLALAGDDLAAVIDHQKQPVKRVRVVVDQLLAALGKSEAYAEGIARRMNLRGRIGQPAREKRAYVRDPEGQKVMFDYAHTRDGEPARTSLTLADLSEDELKKIATALRIACKRLWPRKDDLLAEIGKTWRTRDLEGGEVEKGLRLAMPTWAGEDLQRMPYDSLVIVLSVVRTIPAGGTVAAS